MGSQMRFCGTYSTVLQINRNRRTPLRYEFLECHSEFPRQRRAELTRSRYGWNFARAALSDNRLTGPSLTVRRMRRIVPSDFKSCFKKRSCLRTQPAKPCHTRSANSGFQGPPARGAPLSSPKRRSPDWDVYHWGLYFDAARTCDLRGPHLIDVYSLAESLAPTSGTKIASREVNSLYNRFPGKAYNPTKYLVPG
jgi:hypothetical protein